MDQFRKWGKPVLILAIFFTIAYLTPAEPIDPWQMFSLKKAAYMVFALAFIEALGAAAIRLLGNRKGAILTGFFGGLVSSTATTVDLARDSVDAPPEDLGKQTLTFLSATLAMLTEGVVLLLFGTSEIHAPLFLILSGPILAVVIMIVILTMRIPHRKVAGREVQIEILPVIKLAAFIVAILATSKLLQHFLGQSGLIVLTFLVSLFEIHGSVIANIQMHDAGAFGVEFLGGLITLSVTASFISKMFLLWTIGTHKLRRAAMRYTMALFAVLIASWLVFVAVV
jgi:uncharacterized membrane protein (DUF4010 family)